jgi:polygalacturonase
VLSFRWLFFCVSLLPATSGLPVCNVLDFGAVGDNHTEDTLAIQTAVISCSLVVFPAPGKYLIRAVNLDAHDNLALQIEAGATIVAWSDPDTYNTTTSVYPLLWADGYRNGTSAPLINFSLFGGGIIDGQGWRWWPYGKTRSRPILVSIAHAENLNISNITLLDSPKFHIQVSPRACFLFPAVCAIYYTRIHNMLDGR